MIVHVIFESHIIEYLKVTSNEQLVEEHTLKPNVFTVFPKQQTRESLRPYVTFNILITPDEHVID